MRTKWCVRMLVFVGAFLACADLGWAQRKIVFSQGVTGNELWVVDGSGSTPNKIATMGSYIVTPRWSGDGSRIAFQSGTQLWIINDDGSGLHTVPGASVADSGLTWDSTASGLIYATVCVCCEHLRAVNTDGTNNHVFFNPGGGVIQLPDARLGDFAPSSRVAFFKFQCGGEFSSQFFGVETTREGGVDFTQIPGSPGINRQQIPRWSPDGNRLVTSIRAAATNQWALEILDPFNPVAPRNQLLLGPDSFSTVDFGCSADTLFFARGNDGARNIWRVRSNGSELTQITNFGSGSVRDLDFFCSTIPVTIDIKPGSFPNSINVGSNGTVPVAIFSTATFDARSVDPVTVSLAGASVRLRGQGAAMASFLDVNGDGLLDLVVHVSAQALQLTETDTEAMLEGTTFEGNKVRGTDTVRIVQ